MAKQNYPKTIMEFAATFHSDEICYQYLIESRWPDGFVCPKCYNNGGWWLEKYHRFECTICHRQTSPLSGTLMHRSHLPIHIWFWAAYLVSTHTHGISAVQLQRQLGILKIDTSWFLLHRLREGMVRELRSPLSGFIEADEALGSTIKSDGWTGNSTDAIIGYKHLRLIQQSPQQASELAPHIHRVFSNLKSWIGGIQHGVEPKYLQNYLNEFVFRFNRREHPMSAFRSLLSIVVSKNPMTLEHLTKP